VSSVYEDRAGTLWIANLTGQLYRFSKGTLALFQLPLSAGAPRIRTVFEDSSGALWLGAIGGRGVRVSQGKAVTYTKREGLRSDTVRQIYQDRSGAIWIATDSGLSRWDGRGFQNYYLEDGLSYPSVRCVIEVRNGDVLVGTDAGLNLIHDRRIVPNPVFAELNKEKIWAVYEDASGSLWLGSRGSGLLRVKQGKIARLTMHDGLPSNSIYQILEDSTSKFWISTPSGVFSTGRNELDAVADGKPGPIQIIPFGISEGLESSQMNGGFQSAG